MTSSILPNYLIQGLVPALATQRLVCTRCRNIISIGERYYHRPTGYPQYCVPCWRRIHRRQLQLPSRGGGRGRRRGGGRGRHGVRRRHLAPTVEIQPILS